MNMIEFQFRVRVDGQDDTWKVYDVYDAEVRTLDEVETAWAAAIEGSPTRTWRMVEHHLVEIRRTVREHTP